MGASTPEMSSGPSLHRPLTALRATKVRRGVAGSVWEIICTVGDGNGGGISIVGTARAKSKFNMLQFVPRAIISSKQASHTQIQKGGRLRSPFYACGSCRDYFLGAAFLAGAFFKGASSGSFFGAAFFAAGLASFAGASFAGASSLASAFAAAFLAGAFFFAAG